MEKQFKIFHRSILKSVATISSYLFMRSVPYYWRLVFPLSWKIVSIFFNAVFFKVLLRLAAIQTYATHRIIAMQCVYYVSFGLWLTVIGLFSGYTRSLDLMFKYQDVNIRDYYGISVIVTIILTAITGSFTLWTLIQRTKLCLDFSCTLHLFHILFCIYYNNALPSSILWWIVYIFSCTVMCILGEILCMRTELKAIPVNMTPKVHL